MKEIWKRAWNRRTLAAAVMLILAALIMAAGLEWLMQKTLPPIFADAEVDISADPLLIERGTTYLHSSGRPALVEEWHPLRFLATFVLQMTVLTLLFPLKLGRRMLTGCRDQFQRVKTELVEEKGRIVKLALGFLITFTAVFFLSKAWILDVYQRANWMVDIVCLLAGLGAGSLVTFRRTLGQKPEVFFLILTLISGGMLAFFLPDATTVSLDDGYHFQHALNYSMLGRVRFTRMEWEAMQEDNVKDYSLEQWDAFLAEEDAKYSEGAVFVTTGFHLDIKEHWMGTHGLGLFLGRLLRLHFRDIWCLGRFTGLLAYALIGYFAIRRLKSGKMILSMALMIPSCVFLAANYSYDPGVIAGMAISCATWIAQWQEPEKKLKAGDVAVMTLGMFFACYVKAIYFPLYLLFICLPKSKFRDRKHQAAYYMTILGAMILIMVHILLPLGKSGGAGDDRASGNVNTFGQIQFILQNPLEYAKILWHFLQNYLNPNKMSGPLNAYGYQGVGNNTALIMLVMAAVTFTDAREEGLLPGTGIRIGGLVLLFGSLVLMITSMYVWFSEVGSTTFDGMQPRYMIPFIYPAMALMGSNRIRNRQNPAIYNGVLFAGMTFANISGILLNCVTYYR